MSSEDQANAYREEARLTLESAHSIYETAASGRGNMWAQVVKNAYDSIEQAISAAIAERARAFPEDIQRR